MKLCFLPALFLAMAALRAESLPFANGDFSQGMNDWKLEVASDAEATAQLEAEAFDGKPAVCISVANGGEHTYGVSLVHSPITIEAGRTYTLRIHARMETGEGKVYISANRDHAPWGEVVKGGTIVLKGIDWRDYTYTFEAPETETVRISLGNLGVSDNVFYFASITLETP